MIRPGIPEDGGIKTITIGGLSFSMKVVDKLLPEGVLMTDGKVFLVDSSFLPKKSEK